MIKINDHMTGADSAPSRRYAVITPCRNEAEYLQQTIDSMAAQSVLPAVWIIVDDGSTDETPAILERARNEHPFIRVVHRKDRGERAVGPGVIEAFYDGLATMNLDDYDYICKLDGDLLLPLRYFENLMERMEADSLLGNLSGKTYIRTKNNKLVSERMGDENAIGAMKFYRVACFKDIGGFVRQVCWDGIDGHMCRLKGWIASSIDEEELRVIHLRPQGSSQKSVWTGRMRWGRGKYFMGSSLAYIIAVSMYRAFERPFVLGGIGILIGYLSAFVRRQPRFEDREYRRFFRRYELKSLLIGKHRTLTVYDRRIRKHRASSMND